MSKKTLSKETLEQFLARGGTITRLPPGPSEEEHNVIPATSFAVARFLSPQQMDNYYGTKRGSVAVAPLSQQEINESLKGDSND